MATKQTQTQKIFSPRGLRRGISAKRYLPETPSPVKEGASARKTGSADINSSAIREQIQKKAYDLYERRGYSHGNDLQDWLEAEQIVAEELAGK